MNRIFTTLIITTLSTLLLAQDLTQNIRGKVLDETTGYPLIGATIVLLDSDPVTGSTSDENGFFEIPGIPIGRQSIEIRYTGYEPRSINNFLLSSAKEFFIEVKLHEKVTSINEVVVKSHSNKEEALNQMAMISARSFSIEETERYAGSLGDPARMVANFAGVMTQNDSRNDIIIRGNSPIGVQWRLEGMDIPNPNHFGALGTTGGPVSMLNNNLLSNSDFITGAFPAQYGNAMSGVFDLNMRSGNNKKREYTGQIGFNGFELGAEGPVKVSENGQNASYLANFRYSTLDVFNKIGFDVGTGAAIPQYKDLTFIFDLPGTKWGRFKLIGLWGDSFIALGREAEDTTANNYNPSGTATDFGSELGFIGMTHTYFFTPNSRIKSAVSYQYTQATTKYDSVFRKQDIVTPEFRSTQFESRMTASTEFKQKVNSKNNISIGAIFDAYKIDYIDSAMIERLGYFVNSVDINENMYMLRSYAQWQHNFSNALTAYAGVYSQFFNLNNDFVVEPRASLRWRLTRNQSLTLGYGKHSQIQPKSAYFFQTYNEDDDVYSLSNTKMGFSKSDHYVLGYQNMLGESLRLKAEAYYQYLYNIPIAGNPDDEYEQQVSMVNAGDFFAIPFQDELVNDGHGENYGLELTLEKFLDEGYYFLMTASLFDSKYKAADGKWRNTAFNGNYVFNILGGYERKLSPKTMLTLDLKTVLAGGRRYTPIDVEASMEARETKYDWSQAWNKKHDDYFRTDFRIGIKLNGKKTSQEWAIDLQNVTGYQSIFMEGYDVEKNEIYQVYQQGFLPMFLYRIQF